MVLVEILELIVDIDWCLDVCIDAKSHLAFVDCWVFQDLVIVDCFWFSTPRFNHVVLCDGVLDLVTHDVERNS